MAGWWMLRPIIAPLPHGFMDDDRSHKEAREWMNKAADEIERLRAREARLRKALQDIIDMYGENLPAGEIALAALGEEKKG
jgi:hypothetical protein